MTAENPWRGLQETWQNRDSYCIDPQLDHSVKAGAQRITDPASTFVYGLVRDGAVTLDRYVPKLIQFRGWKDSGNPDVYPTYDYSSTHRILRMCNRVLLYECGTYTGSTFELPDPEILAMRKNPGALLEERRPYKGCRWDFSQTVMAYSGNTYAWQTGGTITFALPTGAQVYRAFIDCIEPSCVDCILPAGTRFDMALTAYVWVRYEKGVPGGQAGTAGVFMDCMLHACSPLPEC